MNGERPTEPSVDGSGSGSQGGPVPSRLTIVVASVLLSALAPLRGAAEDAAGVSLRQFALATEVEERQPVDPGDTFSRGEVERIYAFLDVRNPGREPVTLTVHWARPDGSDRFEATEIEIPGHRRWRTWAYTSPSRLGPGEHLCRVTTPDGDEIGRRRFRVVE